MLRISPLARKLCTKQGIDPATLRGTGPRGRIMAGDVCPKPGRRSGPALRDFAIAPTHPEKNNYYIYDGAVNMSALAAISLPIAVQCEKLLEKRYSLFDYIIRAVVKACISSPAWRAEDAPVDTLLFEQHGEQVTAIPDAAGKSIYALARAAENPLPAAAVKEPAIIICDAQTRRAQVVPYLGGVYRPAFGFVVRGGSPKVGIRAGREQPSDFVLSYTFYANADVLEPAEANRIAARLHNLLYNPVSLLLL